MGIDQRHSWDVTPAEARVIQNRLREEVTIATLKDDVRLVAGADISYDLGSNTVYAAIVVLNFPELSVIERSGVIEEVEFPYIPGLLAFREGPPVLQAWEKLQTRPDVIVFDAHGLSHPRRLGLASHLGVVLNVPSIGCAKSKLVGYYEEPGERVGDWSPLVDGDEIIGGVLRTREGVSPIFVSIGHRVDLSSAIQFLMRCVRGYRIPEPTRHAHLQVNQLRRGEPTDKQLGLF